MSDRQDVKVKTSNSGRRYVEIEDVISRRLMSDQPAEKHEDNAMIRHEFMSDRWPDPTVMPLCNFTAPDGEICASPVDADAHQPSAVQAPEQATPRLTCTECPHVFTDIELAAENPLAWGHPCPTEPVGTLCESFRQPLNEAQAVRIAELEAAIIKTLDDNAELADGDVCTLIDLKRAVPEWDRAALKPKSEESQ